MAARCDHVAVLVRDLEAARARLTALELPEGEVSAFPHEGTRELYLGASNGPGRLLLVQPLGDGPYARAMAKRGPGLHHIALTVADPARWAQGRDGWLLHPYSLQSLPDVAWLCRPGVGTLIEVSASVMTDAAPATVTRVEVPGPAAGLVSQLEVQGTVLAVATSGGALTVGGRHLDAAALGA